MQLAKVVITSALIIVACAEGLPKGKDCVLKSTQEKRIFRTAYLGCYTQVYCSMNFNVLTMCTGIEYRSFSHQKRENELFTVIN